LEPPLSKLPSVEDCDSALGAPSIQIEHLATKKQTSSCLKWISQKWVRNIVTTIVEADLCWRLRSSLRSPMKWTQRQLTTIKKFIRACKLSIKRLDHIWSSRVFPSERGPWKARMVKIARVAWMSNWNIRINAIGFANSISFTYWRQSCNFSHVEKLFTYANDELQTSMMVSERFNKRI
jgi:hypothetical protein